MPEPVILVHYITFICWNYFHRIVIVMAAKGSKTENWFADLDKELDKKTEKAKKDEGAETSQREDVNRTLIADFWKILLRFEKINIHFTIEPSHTLFAQFEKYPYDWSLKDNFDYGGVNQVQIVDRTREHGRIGDTLRARYYKEGDDYNIRFSFEYCEGEHYYKYSGWKRIYGKFILYDAPLNKLDLDQVHAILVDIVRAWYESHLKHDRDMLLTHLKENYEKGETYSQ